jgi:hypothetical protein
MRQFIWAFIAFVAFPPVLPANAAEPLPELWLYYPTNFQVDASVEKARQVWSRAAKAGYTHVLLADSKFAKLGDLGGMTARYTENVERAKKVASELKLTLVPAVFNVGYSNSMLWHDPNLAEGLPVKDSLFVVGPGGEAKLVQDPEPKLGKVGFKDDNVSIEGDVATVEGTGPLARFTYRLKLPKNRCYHVSVKIKTDHYKGKPEIKALAADKSGRSLQWQNLGVESTQEWTEYHVVFNTLDHPEVNLYFGVWHKDPGGTLWWKDWKVEEVGLLNVLRRPGAPLTVKGEDGKTYTEGVDYDRIEDPQMGSKPWPGEYRAWRAEPSPTIKTKLKEGARLRVSWYHPAIIYDGQVSACIAEPRTRELLADEAKRVKALFDAPGYMMSHDEFRTLGWDEACRHTGKTPGQMLADNARFCRELLKPRTAYVWNDMFDSYHNAVAGPYYLVNGPWTGAWEGLDKDVVIVNWNYDKRDESLKFFADRGHRQIIAGYYDGGHNTRKWVEAAGKVKGVAGYMYTTWRGDYGKIEAFARECRGAE